MFQIEPVDLTFYDIVGGQNSDKFEDFFALYERFLPQYLHYGPLMRQRAISPADPEANIRWHQWLVCQHDEPVGMLTFLYNRKRNLGLALDFAILPKARGIQYQQHSRLAGLMLSLAMEQIKRDAEAVGNPIPVCMVGEVEHLPLAQRYTDYGFVHLPVEYYEPPVTPDLAALVDAKEVETKVGYRQLYLGAFGIPGGNFNPSDPQTLREVLEMLLIDHYNLPEDHWIMQTALKSIPS
ncbi:MAG: hypothetical protein AB1894_26015 [Chloroflexota bacterium]